MDDPSTGLMEDPLLTVKEVAGFLRLNEQTVRNMVDRGELSAVRVGARRVRIRRSALDGFIATDQTAEDTTTAPDEADDDSWLRGDLADALVEAQAQLTAGDDRELAGALRSLAHAASQLAEALERSSRRD